MYQTDVSRLTASGNGTAVEFPVAMPLYDVKHLQVWEYVAATGVLTLLTRGTNYTLSLYADYSGGMVQFVHDPGGGSVVYAPATGTSFIFLRVVPFTQDTNLRNWGKNDQEALERQIDLAFMAISQLEEVVGRCAKLDVTYGAGSGADFLTSIRAEVVLAVAARVAAETAQGLAEDARDAAIAAAASVPTFGAFGLTLAATTTASNARASLVLGTAAEADTGTGAGDVPVLDAGGKIAVGVLPVGTTAGTVAAGDDPRFSSGADNAARDIAIFDSFLNQIDLGRASGAIPSGYMHLFASDELATKTGATYDAANKLYSNGPITQGVTPTVSFAIAGGYTRVNRAVAVANNAVVTALGMYSNTAHSGVLYIVERTAANTYTMRASIAYTHTGTGFEVFALASAYTVPASGTFYIGAYLAGGFTLLTSTSIAGATIIGGMTLNTSTAGFSEYTSTTNTIVTGYMEAAGNMTLIPAAITAGSAPDTVDLYLLHRAIDATTLNTDIKARVSRDNGSTWSDYITLAEVCQYDAEYKLLKGTADLSALASGTSVKWEITTLNTKSQRVRAAVMILNS